MADAGQDWRCAASIHDRLSSGADRTVGCSGADAGSHAALPKLFPRKTLRIAAGDPVSLDDLLQKPLTAATLR